jgi:hypothetical protein
MPARTRWTSMLLSDSMSPSTKVIMPSVDIEMHTMHPKIGFNNRFQTLGTTVQRL